MKEVLVPLDGSEHAELALAPASDVAKALGAGICLVAVHPADEELWAAAQIDLTAELSHRRVWLEGYLEGVARKLRADVPDVRWEVRQGDVSGQLRDAAAAEDTAIVAIATSGEAGFQGIPSTSVTDRLVRAKLKPVLVVPPHADSTAGTGLLVPLDGSTAGAAALSFARELAKTGGAPLHLVHVVNANLGWAIAEDAQERLTTALRDRGTEYLGSVAQTSETTAVLEGPVLDAVLDYAAEHDCGLVLLATHGRSGPERIELGSVADGIVRAADRPVILVPAGA